MNLVLYRPGRSFKQLMWVFMSPFQTPGAHFNRIMHRVELGHLWTIRPHGIGCCVLRRLVTNSIEHLHAGWLQIYQLVTNHIFQRLRCGGCFGWFLLFFRFEILCRDQRRWCRNFLVLPAHLTTLTRSLAALLELLDWVLNDLLFGVLARLRLSLRCIARLYSLLLCR